MRPKVDVMFPWWCWDPCNPYLELNELSIDVSYISVSALLVKILRFWVLQFLLSWAGFVHWTFTKSNSTPHDICAYISWKFGVPTLRSLGEIACEKNVTLSQKNNNNKNLLCFQHTNLLEAFLFLKKEGQICVAWQSCRARQYKHFDMSHVVLRQLLKELHTKEHFYKTPGVFIRPKVGVMFTWWCWDPYNPYLELNELSSDTS